MIDPCSVRSTIATKARTSKANNGRLKTLKSRCPDDKRATHCGVVSSRPAERDQACRNAQTELSSFQVASGASEYFLRPALTSSVRESALRPDMLNGMSIYPFNVAGTRIPTWLDLLLLASIFLLLRYFHSFWHVSSKGKPKLPLPPGPKGLPILGMTLQVLAPRKQYATLFEGWHQAYARESSMMSFPTLRRKHIVIK